jgi:hypothetical protein
MSNLQMPPGVKAHKLEGVIGYTKFGRGIVKGNPKRCIQCKQPIRKGEAWHLDVTVDGSGNDGLKVITHARCPNGAYR